MPGKLNVFGHNCHPFGMNCVEVGVFQKTNQICLCCFLQSQYGTCLEAMSYLPTSRAILQTSHEKGIFQIRSSVLFWNWQILQRALVPGWYIWGLFTFPAFRDSFWGTLPPTVGWSFLLAGSSPPSMDGPASAATWANCQVSDVSGDLPSSPSLSASLTHCAISSGVGLVPSLELGSPPALGVSVPPPAPLPSLLLVGFFYPPPFTVSSWLWLCWKLERERESANQKPEQSCESYVASILNF